MIHTKKIVSIGFLLLGLGGLHAQESPTASGGEATGLGGTTNYSIGQVVYTANTGTNGSVAQGVQQPYEISVTLGVNETTINLEMNVYPNPTTNYLTLKVRDTSKFTYQLFDVQGKVIKNKEIKTISTTIKMGELPNATYFLKVTSNNQLIKTFKIIKQ